MRIRNSLSCLAVVFASVSIAALILNFRLFGMGPGFGTLSPMAAPSSLDPAFGNDGKVVSSPDGSEAAWGVGMALQSDGKIVMIGNGGPPGFMVARYNSNGSLDTTFGSNGWTSVTFGAFQETAAALDIQPDGKIVVGVRVRLNNFDYDFGIARLNADGTLDNTFDGDGKLTLAFNDVTTPFHNDYLGVLKVGSDGKIVVAGMAVNSTVDDRFILARINPNGSLDATFGINGKKAEFASGSNIDWLTDMVILPDGKIVVVGYLLFTARNSLIAIKYSINGTREWMYQVQEQTSNLTNLLNGIAAQPDGKFIVAGKRGGKVALIRLNANGTEDTSFNNPVTMPDGEARSVAIQADGKIVVNVAATGFGSFSLFRFNTNGTLDPGFNGDGMVSTTVTNGNDIGKKVIIQPDGKILVGGSSTLGSPTRQYFSMIRYMGGSSAGNVLFDYDRDGRADIAVYRASNNNWYIFKSGSGQLEFHNFGLGGDILTPADFDGDGKFDLSIFRPSTGFTWFREVTTGNYNGTQFGASGDIPVHSDFTGDGKADYVVFRPSNGTWYRYDRINNQTSIIQFGTNGDIPVIADFDGDGKSDLAVYRPSLGDWYWMNSSNGQFFGYHFGATGDLTVPADYDGDGKTEFAVYRPSDGGWYRILSGNGQFASTQFGISTDKPIPADYDGDGKADIGVFRQGLWIILNSQSGSITGFQFGVPSDDPIPNVYVR